MSLFGSLMADVEEDPFFGIKVAGCRWMQAASNSSHMRHMRHMNNMMNSLFSDPFGMLGGEGPLAIAGPRHSSALMPFMPQMPSLNRLFRADLDHGQMNAGTSFSSSTVVMSSGPNGKPQVISSSSSTKIGPGGIKETRKTMQDSRSGTKKMSIGHHIGERAHLIEREQNVYTGDAEERQEFINLDEEEAVDFDREFQNRAGVNGSRGRAAIAGVSRAPARLALPAPPAPPAPSATVVTALPANTSSECGGSPRRHRAVSRRPLRTAASPLTLPTSSNVREVYSSSHPQRHRHKVHKANRHSPNHN